MDEPLRSEFDSEPNSRKTIQEHYNKPLQKLRNVRYHLELDAKPGGTNKCYKASFNGPEMREFKNQYLKLQSCDLDHARRNGGDVSLAGVEPDFELYTHRLINSSLHILG